jgi:hypothetical protein
MIYIIIIIKANNSKFFLFWSLKRTESRLWWLKTRPFVIHNCRQHQTYDLTKHSATQYMDKAFLDEASSHALNLVSHLYSSSIHIHIHHPSPITHHHPSSSMSHKTAAQRNIYMIDSIGFIERVLFWNWTN